MKKVLKLISVAVASGFIAISNVLADADFAVQPSGTAAAATTHVDISVTIPEVLIFGVGALGDSIAALAWTVGATAGTTVGNNQTYSGASGAFTAPAPFSTTPTAAISANGGTGASASGDTANLPVFLFSNNNSDVTITTSVAGGATGTGTVNALDHATLSNTIAIAEFTAGDGGSISHPSLTSASTASTAHTAGVVNLADIWTYKYTPVVIPVAGTYQARITYVAAQP